MNKKYITSLLLGGVVLANVACTDIDEDKYYQQEYHKILYLKTSGEIDATLFQTGQNTDYSITIIKAGSDPSLAANVHFAPMTQTELDIYCASRGTEYQAMPATCYTLGETDFKFDGNEPYKTTNLVLKTSEIDALLKNNPDIDYVLPFSLTSQQDSINADKNLLILKPSVVVPSISFKESGVVNEFMAKSGKTLEIPMNLQIDNQWDFDCNVEVDFTALEGTAFEALPANAYELENGGKVAFKAGSNASLKIKVNPLTQASGVIPLRIKNIEGKDFAIDKEPVLIRVSIDKYPLTASMLSTNAKEPSEGSLEALLDGDVTSYFHSAWSVSIADKHYVQVAIPDNLTSFWFSYTNRQANGNAALAWFDVQISSDGQNFTKLKDFAWDADGLPGGAAGVYESPALTSQTPFRYIRFTMTGNNWTGGNFFVWSEFSLYGM